MPFRRWSVLPFLLLSMAFAACGIGGSVDGSGNTSTPDVSAPEFNPPPTVYRTGQTVSITTRTAGAVIRYTTDGSTPSTTSPAYGGPILVSGTTTIRAAAWRAGMDPSPVSTGVYRVTGKVSAPTLSPGTGVYGTAQNVAISTATPGSTIRYTLDGSAPTRANGTVYAGPVHIPQNTTVTLRAIAYQSDWDDSEVVYATYSVTGTVRIPPAPRISSSRYRNVVVKSDGTVWVWGDADFAATVPTDRDPVNGLVPLQVPGPGGVGYLTGVVSVATGRDHALALKADGTVWAWGYGFGSLDLGNGYIVSTVALNPVQVLGLDNVVSVAAGSRCSYAVRGDGSVWSWGSNDSGQLGDGTTQDRTAPVRVVGPGAAGYLADIVSVSAGDTAAHVVAVSRNGSAWSWGSNSRGQLGDGTTQNRTTPVQVVGPGGGGILNGAAAATVAEEHSFVLKGDGTVWGWGGGTSQPVGFQYPVGLLGDGSTADRTWPVQVKGPGGEGVLTGVSSLSTSKGCTMVSRVDGTVLAWGPEVRYVITQFPDPYEIGRVYPAPVPGPGGTGELGGAVAVSTSSSGNFAVRTDGTVWGWGYNPYGVIGDGTADLMPYATAGAGTWSSVSPGNGDTAAVKADGTAWQWGNQVLSYLWAWAPTNGPAAAVPIPAVDNAGFLTGISSISRGGNHHLFLKTDGSVLSWGWDYMSNNQGALGDGTTLISQWPVAVLGPGGTGHLTGISSVAAGAGCSLALGTDGRVWGWGNNGYGTVGDNSWEDRLSPVPVAGPGGVGFLENVVCLSMRHTTAAAVKADGTVWGWGANWTGGVGDGTADHRCSPVQVVGPGGIGVLDNIVRVAVGGETLALAKDGTVWTWGDGQYTPVQKKGPGGIGVLDRVVAVAAGNRFSLALRSDGTVWAWGENKKGQLGDGTFTSSPAPVQVRSFPLGTYLTGVVSIAAGYDFAIARKADGSIWGWGDNWVGNLGSFTHLRPTPVQVISSLWTPGPFLVGPSVLPGLVSAEGGGGCSVGPSSLSTAAEAALLLAPTLAFLCLARRRRRRDSR
jgi:alpha-tubulin suppressor-like RCC1 family protein